MAKKRSPKSKKSKKNNEKKSVARVKPSKKRVATAAPRPSATSDRKGVARRSVPKEVQVVGIGASAGGLDAFKKFLREMPVESGLAFVLIPHLDPTHASMMVDLLARETAMAVTEVRNGMRVEANHIYVIPPNKYMSIKGGALHLTQPVIKSGV